jgi:hypothetical protein
MIEVSPRWSIMVDNDEGFFYDWWDWEKV